MFYLVYNALTAFLIIPVLAFHLYQKLRGKNPPSLAERFGHIPGHQLQKIAGRPVIWVHAVSVGETVAARPLLEALRRTYPRHAIVVSNSTSTGREVSGKIAAIDVAICFPFDFLPAVSKALHALRPDLVIIMETEIWANFTREAARRKIPVLLANGRISDRSFGRYLRFKWAFRPALQLFSALCMQTGADSERIVAIGAPREKTVALGNLKCDVAFHEVSRSERAELRTRYCIPENLTVITAGSTRTGEDEHILKAYQELLAERPDLFLVLAPRHPERSGQLAGLLEQKGVALRRRTSLGHCEGGIFRAGEALLVDTVGELLKLYALADLAFVGGSLVPIGGHNLLEPASRGVPSVFGPHMNNFREITALVLRYEAGIQVKEPEELVRVLRQLVNDSEKRRLLGQNALKMMEENGGGTAKHMEIIRRFLPLQ